MKAMVLAAGLGTRLRPLTDDRPKALVTVAGRTMLEIALEQLRAAGVTEVIVNAHHFAEQIEQIVKGREDFGMRVEVSRETELLDTGGGIKHAAWFFLEDGPDRDAPFIVHNVDVISTIDLARMICAYTESNALATLAVAARDSSRQLIFDDDGLLCGRRVGREAEPQLVRPVEQTEQLAFSGIHVLSPRIFSLMHETGAFSIIDAYLRLSAAGEKIAAFRADEYCWRDLGKPESIAAAEDEMIPREIAAEAGELISELRSWGWTVGEYQLDARIFGNWFLDLRRSGHTLRLVKDRSQFMLSGPLTQELRNAGLWQAFDSFEEFRGAITRWAIDGEVKQASAEQEPKDNCRSVDFARDDSDK
jgi:NDP-sugar pyrophosphorylase family protein